MGALACPVPLSQAIAAVIGHPTMRHPMITRAACLPATAYPLVPSTDPVPVAANPDIAWRGRNAHDFHLRRGRGDHDPGIAIVARRPRYHANAPGRDRLR